ncbi:MAG: LytTR family transcriptional regulator DNA-binding domain-containing protein [Tannerellaceae bacterium]|jgi:DNA-binding LytR/AlgR family response regulator|nr:LytTR family transcriptional regulator DNA-binding domain-containing protein [Tannerellaceae bacterium]
MRETSKEKMIDSYLKETCFIIADSAKCFFMIKNGEIKFMKIHMLELLDLLVKYDDFVRINRNVIINTVYFIDIYKNKDRMILMKTGNILKVSRRNWVHFKK